MSETRLSSPSEPPRSGVSATEVIRESAPASATEEAQKVLRRASPLRWVGRVALGVAILGASLGGGYLGYRAMLKKKATDAPMVRFEGAEARIGNDAVREEAPAHDVALDVFLLDVTEVTVFAYRVCMEDEACSAPLTGGDCNYKHPQHGEDHPINCVTYAQADAFCAWKGGRLPTEEEWERAARGTSDKSTDASTDIFPWGTTPPTAELVNACGAECSAFFSKADEKEKLPSLYKEDDGFPTTAPVGRFVKGDTKDGLADMSGNVWEWTSSGMCPYDQRTCGEDVDRVIRGGGFHSYVSRALAVTRRAGLARDQAIPTVGFRCAKGR